MPSEKKDDSSDVAGGGAADCGGEDAAPQVEKGKSPRKAEGKARKEIDGQENQGADAVGAIKERASGPAEAAAPHAEEACNFSPAASATPEEGAASASTKNNAEDAVGGRKENSPLRSPGSRLQTPLANRGEETAKTPGGAGDGVRRAPSSPAPRHETEYTRVYPLEVSDAVSAAPTDARKRAGTSAQKKKKPAVPADSDQWMENYTKLVDYRIRYGTASVSPVPDKANNPERHRLYWWAGLQRKLKKMRLLEEDRVMLLDEIDFEWIKENDAHDDSKVRGVVKKRRKRVENDPEDEEVNTKRRHRAKDEPSKDEKERFRSRLREAEDLSLKRMPPPIWMERFGQLKKFGEEHGHLNVPRPPSDRTDQELSRLYNWLKSVRRQAARGSLRNERVQLLNAIGLEWNEKERAGTGLDRLDDTAELKDPPDEAHKGKLGEKNGRRGRRQGRKERVLKSTSPSGAKGKKRKKSPSPPPRRKRSRQEVCSRRGMDMASTVVVPRGEKREENWRAMFEEMKDFRERVGHCKVPYSSNHRLCSWASYQRSQWLSGKLSEERTALLESLGFEFSYYGSARKAEARKGLLRTAPEDKKEDARHVDEQGDGEESVVSDGLPEDETKMPAARWMVRYEQLKKYHANHGNFSVPLSFNTAPEAIAANADPELVRLSEWLREVIKEHNRGSLRREKMDLLEHIGFDFSTQPALDDNDQEGKKLYVPPPRWMKRYQQLREYHKEHGHFSIPVPKVNTKDESASDADHELRQLHYWVRSLRKQYKSGSLREERRKLLEDIGFDFSGTSVAAVPWVKMVQELQKFKDTHGHLRVSCTAEDKKNNTELYRLTKWVQKKRKFRADGTLSEDRIAQLDSMGFIWEKSTRQQSVLAEVDWDTMFQKLEDYHSEHGDCSIRTSGISREEDPELYQLQRFILAQRAQRKKGCLSDDQIQLLDSLGFDWAPMKTRKEGLWEAHFRRLELFKIEHGHTRVPDKWEEDKKLAGFVSRMRYLWRLEQEGRLPEKDQNVLTPERKARLLEIGFEISLRPERGKKTWEDRYEQLREFFEERGHCDVPCRYNKVLLLPRWCKEQRKQYRLLFSPEVGKTSKLTMEQHRRLEDLGFDFTGQRVGERCAKRWHLCTCDFDDNKAIAEDQTTEQEQS